MLHAWQMEDRYFSLIEELEMLREAGFKQADVLWRRGSTAVIAAMKLPLGVLLFRSGDFS
jgi:hypothetical protein